MRRIVWLYIVGIIYVVAILASRHYNGPLQGTATPILEHAPTPLAAVESLPEPTLPSFIDSITPRANTTVAANGQISIVFRHPLVPLGRIDQVETLTALKYFSVTSGVEGKFRLANPNLVVFEPTETLPAAARLEVTIKKGLKDLAGNTISEDIRWTFDVDPLQIWIYAPETAPLNPKIDIRSNVPVQLEDLKKALHITSGQTKVPAFSIEVSEEQRYKLRRSSLQSSNRLVALLKKEENDPTQAGHTHFIATFSAPLQKATPYNIVVAKELMPAYGNLALAEAASKDFSTFYPLQATLSGFPSAVFTDDAPRLEFNNDLVEGAEKFIQVSPLPKAKWFVYRGYAGISFDDRYLKAQTEYTFTIKPGVKDVFGQTLEGSNTFTFTTGDYRPGMWAPEGVTVLQPSLDQKLTLHYVNTHSVRQTWHALSIRELQTLGKSDDIYANQLRALLPNEKQWQALPGGQHNELVTHDYDLTELLHGESGVLVYGFKTDLPVSEEFTQQPERIGLLARTNLGVYSQWLPQQGSAQVYSLADGSPMPGVTVNVYTLDRAKPCVSGITNENGGMDWNNEQIAPCFAKTDVKDGAFSNAPRLLLEVKKDQDWTFAFSHINQRRYYGNYSETVSYEDRMGVPQPLADWSGKHDSRGVLFSDRFMYKPGETATFTGMVRFMRQGKLYTPKDHDFTLELTDPDGAKKKLGQVTTNAYGSFSTTVSVPADAKLGFWELTATTSKAPDPEYSLRNSFRVAEFRAPPFKVQAQADKPKAYSQQDVTVSIDADYLHGAPLASAKANVSVTRDQLSPSFDGYEEFSFGKPYIYQEFEKEPLFEGMVLQQALVLNDLGKTTLPVKIDKLPYPARYTVEAEVSDSSNASLTGRTTFEAYPSKQVVGLHTLDYVISADMPVKADVVVLDTDGKPLKGVKVTVALKHIEWNSALHALSNGLDLEQHPTLEVRGTTTVTSDMKPVRISLPVTRGGQYVLEASVASQPATLAASEVFVAGNEEASWYQSSDDTVNLKLNKTDYKIGDTANVLVQSPYPEAEVLFSVLRNKLFYRERRTIKGTSTLFSFKVTPDMLPNAEVQVMLTRRGDIKSAKHLVRLGASSFSVNHEQLALKIGMTAEHATLEPRQHQTIKIQLQDADNKPVQGQVSVIVANEAILQLNNHRPPNLLDTFYAYFPVNYIVSDNRNYVQLLPNFKPFEKGWGYGGGLASALANNLLRKNFQPMPFYRLDVVTDAAGKAEVGFDMPDDLTTWRVMAVAADDAQHFGNNDITFKTSKLLIADPVLPRFARLHDTFDGGIQLINSSKKTGTVKIRGEVTQPFQFVTQQGLASAVEWRVKLSDKPLAQRVPIRVMGLGSADLRFKVEGENDLKGLSDGFKLSLTGVIHQSLEGTVQVGASKEATTRVPLNLREDVVENIGGLTVEAGSTLMPAITEPLDYMIQYPFGCVEQTSTRLIALANMKWLSSHYEFPLDTKKLDNDVAAAFKHLLKMQTDSGGFAFWVGQREATYGPINAHTARALQALTENGFAVPNEVKKNLGTYLDRELRDVKRYTYWYGIALDEIRGLEALGSQRDDYLQEIFAARETLGQIDRVKLALVLSTRPAWTKEFEQFMRELRTSMVFDGRTAQLTGNTGNDLWGWLGDMQVQQALALRAFAQYPSADDALVDRLLRGLLNARKDGLWNNTYSNAQALDALVYFARAREAEKPNYTLEVKLAERSLLKEVFDRFKQTDVFTPMQQLPSGKSVLDFNKQGTGTLHYLVSYRYSPLAPAPGRDSGINVKRVLTEAGNDKPLAEWNESVPDKALILHAGQTYRVKLHVTLKQWSSHIAISDLLPAGLEAVDTRLVTSSQQYQTNDDWSFSYKETADQRVDAFIDQANPGAYDLEYFVRAVTPGSYTWPGGEAMLMYTPETFGRTAASALEIKE